MCRYNMPMCIIDDTLSKYRLAPFRVIRKDEFYV